LNEPASVFRFIGLAGVFYSPGDRLTGNLALIESELARVGFCGFPEH
jgi:hypothetical protein